MSHGSQIEYLHSTDFCTTMISIVPADLPPHFHDSIFFNEMSIEDLNEVIELEEKVVKLDFLVSTKEEMYHLLETFRFWDIPEHYMHHALAEFYIQKSKAVIQSINDEFYKAYPILCKLRDVHTAQREKRMHLAAQYGLVAVMRYLITRDVQYTGDVCDAAASSGNLECLTLARELGYEWTKYSQKIVLKSGAASCLDFLLLDNARANRHDCMEFAMCTGNESFMTLLRDTYNVPWPLESTYHLPKHGKLQCLKNAIDDGCVWRGKECEVATECGHFECLRFAVSSGANPGNSAATAAKHGRLEYLQYLLNNDATVGDAICAAAGRGHLECMKLGIEAVGGIIGSDVAAAAAQNGQLECLQYLKDHGFNVHGLDVLFAAVEVGHLSCLQLILTPDSLARHGSDLCDTARQRNREGCLAFLLSQGSTYEASLPMSVVRKGWTKAVQALFERGVQFTSRDCIFAASGGHLECLRFLHESANCQMNENVCQEAAKGGHVECLKYAVEQGCPVAVKTCRVADGACRDYLRTLKF